MAVSIPFAAARFQPEGSDLEPRGVRCSNRFELAGWNKTVLQTSMPIRKFQVEENCVALAMKFQPSSPSPIFLILIDQQRNLWFCLDMSQSSQSFWCNALGLTVHRGIQNPSIVSKTDRHDVWMALRIQCRQPCNSRFFQFRLNRVQNQQPPAWHVGPQCESRPRFCWLSQSNSLRATALRVRPRSPPRGLCLSVQLI